MVAAASAQSLRPAEVAFTFHKPVTAWRDGDQCWISPNSLIGWGWAYNFVGNEATIQAEGRTVKVTGQSLEGKYVLPFHEVLKQLGSDAKWTPGKDQLTVLGQCRFITVREGKVSVDSTLSFEPTVTMAESPSRIIVDLKGTSMGAWCKQDLDATARAGQYSSDTVRIIIVTNEKPTLSAQNPTRSLNLLYSLNPTVDPTVTVPPVEKPNTFLPAIIGVGPVQLVSETPNSAQLTIPLSSALPNPARYRRIDATSFELFFPRGNYIAPAQPLGSPSVTAFEPEVMPDGLKLTVRLARPMGVEYSVAPNSVSIGLYKPKIGDGKLSGKVVVIDAGHGGHDSGARSNDKATLEKDVTLKVATQAAKEFLAEGATVIMTRKSDVFIPLGERAEIANRNSADFFISVHINSNKTANSTSGSISFHHKGSKAGEILAICMQDQMKGASTIPSIGVWSDGRIYENGFAVLRLTKMPGVLLELGFVNHNRDRDVLRSESFHLAIAKAIVKGVKVYLGNEK
jgi:N-acetylmuramoyl-L-alanine amidase